MYNDPNLSSRRVFVHECIGLALETATILYGINSLKKQQPSHEKPQTSQVIVPGRPDNIQEHRKVFSMNGVLCEVRVTGVFKDEQCQSLINPCISVVLQDVENNMKISLAQDAITNGLIVNGVESSRGGGWTVEERSLLMKALGELVSATEAEKAPPPNVWKSGRIPGTTCPEMLAWFQANTQEGTERFLRQCLEDANYRLGKKHNTTVGFQVTPPPTT